jgi:hypothetical protein
MLDSDVEPSKSYARQVITAAQMGAARAMPDIDQRALARLSGLSVPTIQRMEASAGVARGATRSRRA